MFILAISISCDSRHVEFLQDYLLSNYTQTHGFKGIFEIFDSKTPCYFIDNSNVGVRTYGVTLLLAKLHGRSGS